MRAGIAVTLLAVVLVAGCSDDGDSEAGGSDAAAVETTAPETVDVTVRLVAEQVGLGCSRTAPIGNDSQLVILDPSGTRLGVGTFQLSPGLTKGVDTCDWTAVAREIDPSYNLYVIEGDGQELATVDLAERDWKVELLAGVGGVRLAP